MAHVLVVDDDRSTAELLRFVLEEEGHTVLVETGGWGRVSTLLATTGTPLVVLMDLYLTARWENPILAAIAAQPALAAAHRIFVMTAGMPERAEAELAPVRPYLAGLLEKPFDIAAVSALVAGAALPPALPPTWAPAERRGRAGRPPS